MDLTPPFRFPDRNEPREARLLRLLAGEVKKQARFALSFSADLAATDTSQGTEATWNALQGLVVSAGNVTKILWRSPANKERTKKQLAEMLSVRGLLREFLSVGDASPLRNAQLRNAFEHFDDRLEDWYFSDDPMFVSRNVGSLATMKTFSETKHVFHHFDPDTMTVTFWENSFEVGAVTDELARITPLAAEVAKYGLIVRLPEDP
jgi:hypothetical protein